MDDQALPARDGDDSGSDRPGLPRESSKLVLVHIVEFGESTLDCLRRLTAILERQGDKPSAQAQHGSVSDTANISCELNSPYLDAQKAATYLGTSVKSLYGLVERGQIEPKRGPRRRYRFTKELLDEYLERGTKR